MAMRIRGRTIRLRALLIGVAVLALMIAAAQESLIWYENRRHVDFHEGRADWLRGQGAAYRDDRPDVWREYRRFAAWHDERADWYRRARSVYLSDPLIEDFRRTEREQDFEKALKAGLVGGNSGPRPAGP